MPLSGLRLIGLKILFTKDLTLVKRTTDDVAPQSSPRVTMPAMACHLSLSDCHEGVRVGIRFCAVGHRDSPQRNQRIRVREQLVAVGERPNNLRPESPVRASPTRRSVRVRLLNGVPSIRSQRRTRDVRQRRRDCRHRGGCGCWPSLNCQGHRQGRGEGRPSRRTDGNEHNGTGDQKRNRDGVAVS